MILVGLTGGIGSGKSQVGRLLADRGAVVIDADQVARDVVEPGTPALAAIVREFGAGMLTDEGVLDRQRLADLVFTDIAALRRLEAVTHPAIRERTAVLIVQARDAGAPVVVHETPVLVETGSQDMYDLVVVVDAPDELRVARAVSRGMSEADVRHRMSTQAPRSELLQAADRVIDNSGDLAALTDQVDALWRDLVPVG